MLANSARLALALIAKVSAAGSQRVSEESPDRLLLVGRSSSRGTPVKVMSPKKWRMCPFKSRRCWQLNGSPHHRLLFLMSCSLSPVSLCCSSVSGSRFTQSSTCPCCPTVGEEQVSSIGRGLCVLLGISVEDTQSDADYMWVCAGGHSAPETALWPDLVCFQRRRTTLILVLMSKIRESITNQLQNELNSKPNRQHMIHAIR